ncbi:hypothetical protein R6Z07F_017284 [Ovis aries]
MPDRSPPSYLILSAPLGRRLACVKGFVPVIIVVAPKWSRQGCIFLQPIGLHPAPSPSKHPVSFLAQLQLPTGSGPVWGLVTGDKRRAAQEEQERSTALPVASRNATLKSMNIILKIQREILRVAEIIQQLESKGIRNTQIYLAPFLIWSAEP